MNTITNINSKIFLATALFAADHKELRSFLQGVLVERAVGGGLLYTATNGHVLLHAYDATAEMTGESPRIIQTCHLKGIAQWGKAPSLVHQGEGDSATLATLGNTAITVAPVIDEKFPDYSKVIPKGPFSNEPAQFNPKYLVLFETAGAKAGWGFPHIRHNGNNANLVTFASLNTPAFGVIMPRTVSAPDVPTLAHAQND